MHEIENFKPMRRKRNLKLGKERNFKFEKLNLAKEQQELELNNSEHGIECKSICRDHQVSLEDSSVNGVMMKCRAKVPRMPCFDALSDLQMQMDGSKNIVPS